MLFHERYEKLLKDLFEKIPYCYNSDLLNVMQEFSEPFEIHPYRYDYGITYRTDAFKEACNNFNRKMGTNYHIGIRHNVFEHGKQDEDSIIIYFEKSVRLQASLQPFLYTNISGKWYNYPYFHIWCE